jgi:single-strand DNA-binding protein
MVGVNRVFLIGHLGRDPEVRYTQSGQVVANFSLATTEITGGREGAERQERTEWHNIVVWGKQAEIARQYLRKGRQLFVEGRLQTREWVDPQGVKHYKTEVVCRNFQMLGRRDDGGGGGGDYGEHRGGAGGGSGTGAPEYDEYDIGDLGPPLDMDNNPLSPGD